jgi:hypothetical protein
MEQEYLFIAISNKYMEVISIHTRNCCEKKNEIHQDFLKLQVDVRKKTRRYTSISWLINESSRKHKDK